ncbi:MAG TPA: hypothetical protein VKN18_19295 [Blastocatellia bacterium]|nr:hypothetical protein [Blastocatellia bacterium]
MVAVLIVGIVPENFCFATYIDQFYTAVFSGKEGVTFERGMFWERRLTLAQKRFDQATVSLARVRRLLQGPQAPKNLNLAIFNQQAVSSAYDRRR